MYCSFFGFKEKPFTITPNPRFIFLSKNHREAFAHLLYGIDSRAGFIMLAGEVGTGKTTVLRTLLGQLDESGHRTALIFNPCLSAPELLQSINREFGLPCDGLSTGELLEILNRFLLGENIAGRTVVLIIDEAQNLEPRVLEQIRLISNLETRTDKLIQIVLAGQPELERLLERPELRQLAQRITVRYHLGPLDFEDTRAYIDHRLEKAGDWRAATFTPAALKKIFRTSGGFPRLINIVCDRALLVGYTEESREISGPMAAQAIREIRAEGRPAASGRRLRLATLSLLLLLAVTGLYLLPRIMEGKPAAPANETTGAPVVLARELARNGEAESAMQAFNALAGLWHAPQLPAIGRLQLPRDLERVAREGGLQLTRFTGSLGALLRMDVPAMLEFTLPGTSGRRYLAVTGAQGGRITVAPPMAGSTSIAGSELDGCWSGRAYFLWRNPGRIPSESAPGSRGDGVAVLQRLLAQAGFFEGEATGVYDRETEGSVRAFQTARGLVADGRAGGQTLLLLYRDAKGSAVPRLTERGER